MNSEASINVVVANGFTGALNAVQESQWENRTPCDEWSAAKQASIDQFAKTEEAFDKNAPRPSTRNTPL
jgi:hypothetical protein